MIKRTVVAVCLMLVAAAGVATSAQAQEKTRAQVRQELIEAERNGLNFITDTSYPEVNPIFAEQVARLKQQRSDGGTGGAIAGASDAGNVNKGRSSADPSTCVGPVTFCDRYFGN